MSLITSAIPFLLGAIGAAAARREQNRVLLVVTSCANMGDGGEATGLWLSELTHPYFALVDSGVGADIASIDGGKPPIDPRSDDDSDPDNRRFWGESALVEALENAPALADVDLEAYQGIFFVGGHGTMWDFPESAAIHNAARVFQESGRGIAAVCHGPAALTDVTLADGRHLVHGRTVTVFTNAEEREVGLHGAVPFLLEDRLRERGANVVAHPPWSKHVEVDDNLITGQNPQSAKSVAVHLVKWIKGRQ